MPVYTYHCDCCDHEFDKKQSFSDANLTQCPNCDEGCLRRVYKPARVVFKGSGFYVTDNKSSMRSSAKTSSSDEKSNKKDDTAPKTEKKGESSKKTSSEKKSSNKSKD